MRPSTVQPLTNRDAGKPGRKMAARRNIRRPNASPNMLRIWNPRLNKKSPRTLHTAALTFPSSQPNWDAKTWMSKVRNLSAMTLESCDWTTGPCKLPGKSTTSTVYWCIASKLKAPRIFLNEQYVLVGGYISIQYICHHVVPKSQLDYDLKYLKIASAS